MLEAKKYIQERTNGFVPEIGMVLGTGLGGFVENINIEYKIPYSEIPHMPVSTVAGHQGMLIFGTIGGKKVMAMQGRFHYYEGYTMTQVTFPIRIMCLLGIKTLIVSNAAGGLNPLYAVGDIMILTDHINLLPNPLIGPNNDEWGPRFLDMHNCYDKEYRDLIACIAEREGIKLQWGVYVADTGPTFETQAEYRYLRVIGGDACGMSTVPETIVARHMGVRVMGLSIITNVGEGDEEGNHEEVQRAGQNAAKNLKLLLGEFIKALN